jgi:DNA-binding NtrC family response regulator
VDVRLIATTARDLTREVAAGRFREDLFYRLNVVHVAIPPLRERPEDVEELAVVLLERAGVRAGRRLRFGPGAMAALRARSWPGNVRELENVIERAAVLAHGDVLDAASLAEPSARAAIVGRTGTVGSGPLRTIVADAERAAILQALEQAGGNRAAAAKLLDVSQRTLYYKMRTLNVE